MLYTICACACVANVCVCCVPPAMCRLSSKCRKLPTSISRRSQSMVMQRRRHVDENPACVTGLPGNCVRGCLCFRRPLRSQGRLGDGAQSGNNACHMANIRIRIMGGRVHVSTLDNRQKSKYGSIAVGAPGRLYNAHRHLMQFAVASLHCHITHLTY